MHRLLFILVLPVLLCAAETSLVDKKFDLLEKESLDQTLAKYQSLSPASQTEQSEYLLTLFFRAERAYFDSEIHLRDYLLRKAESQCEFLSTKEITGKTAAACALVYADQSIQASALQRLSDLKKSQTYYEKSKPTLDSAERFYLDARIEIALTEPVNPRYFKSLLAWQMLKRVRPELTQVSFWIAYLYLKGGNLRAFDEQVIEALRDNNIRSQVVFSPSSVQTRRFLDGVGEGSRFGLFANSVDGIGAGYLVWDDRILDKDRSGRLFLSASTTKSVATKMRYEDAVLLSPFFIQAELGLDYRRAEYFGLGIESLYSDRSLYRRQTASMEMLIGRALYKDLNFGLGWRAYQRHFTEHEEGPLDFSQANGENIFYSGGFFQFEWDRRESQDYSRSGLRAQFRGYFPTSGLLSSWTFQKWTFFVEGDLSFFQFLNRLKLGSILLEGAAPLDALAFTNQDSTPPGLREGRLKAKHLSYASIESKHKLWGPFVLGAYLSTIMSEADLRTVRFAEGGLLEIYLSSLRKRQLRLEAGSYQGEFVFNVNLGLNL